MARKREDTWDGAERRAPTMVMVVNDDPEAAELLGRLLAHAGYRVCRAASQGQAIDVASRELPRAVVLDLTSGGIGANLQVLEAIRHHDDERIARARVVLIARQAANKMFSFQSGTDAFIVRPFHADALIEAVETVVSVPFKDLPQHRRVQIEGGSRAG